MHNDDVKVQAQGDNTHDHAQELQNDIKTHPVLHTPTFRTSDRII